MKRAVASLLVVLNLAGLSMGPALGVTLNTATFAETFEVFPKAFDGWDRIAMGDCFEGLVTEDILGQPIPGQAKSWRVSPDGLTYTFSLREDALWSDGTRVTAQDFVTAFRWLFNPANAVEYANLQFPIRNAVAISEGELADFEQLGVKAIDPSTLEIDLDRPTPHFIEALTHFSAYPIPSERFARLKRKWLLPENIVCNGPFQIVEKGVNVVRSVKSATYYDRARIGLDEVYYYSITRLEDGLDMFERGALDVFLDLPRQATPWAQEHAPAETRIEPYLGVYYFVLNEDNPPLDQPDVRLALSMAIDRDAIDPYGLKTPALSAYGWVPEGTGGYVPLPSIRTEWADWPAERRLARARELLAKHGYGADNPLTLRLRYSDTSDDSHQRIAIAVADMWSRIGVRSELASGPVAEHFDALRTGNFDVGRVTWLLDVSDAANVLDLFRTGNEYNFGRYSSPDFDALMDKAAGEGDLVRRGEILRRAEDVAVRDTAAIPIYWFSIQNLVTSSVEGFEHNPKNIHRSRWISKNAWAGPQTIEAD